MLVEMRSSEPAMMLDPMMLNDSIWETLDAWLTQEVELGNLLHPYFDRRFCFSCHWWIVKGILAEYTDSIIRK